MFTYSDKNMNQQRKGRDPFSTEPLPKSFYFPSLPKHLDESQAIKLSQQASSIEGNKNNNNNFGYPTPVPEMKALPFVHNIDALEKKEDTTTEFDEVWPDSERPSSPSFVADLSAQTAATDMVFGESSMNLEAAVNKLEAYDKHRYQRDSHPSSIKHNGPSEESTLQRYIDRFRRSEPKPREERMKEMNARKQEFWWLQPDSKQTEDHSDFKSNKDEEPVKLGHNKNLEGSYQGAKLTKEALLAMDEATLHLQTKADRLLSKSELSLATSSGPIVSTDGLGTSYSLSDQSSVMDAPAYRPVFVNTKEFHRGEEVSKLASRENRQVHSDAAKPDSGDILARWRFRRKMEESQSQPQPKNFVKPVPSQSAKGCEMDSRLEEFRKRLLSQRMLVTPVDIQFERQKMNMLLEKDDDQQEPGPPKVSSTPTELPSDPVLARLQRITKNHEKAQPHLSIAKPDAADQGVAPTTSGFYDRIPSRDSGGLDINNSSITSQLLSNPRLNKNNTASSNTTAACEDLVCDIDNISAGVQIVTDPKSRVFNLGNSQQGGSSNKEAAPSNMHTAMIRLKDIESKSQNSSPRSENERNRNKRPLRDLPLNQISNLSSPMQEKQKPKEDKLSRDRSNIKQAKDVENNSQVYHQFLPAEKPNSDLSSQEITPSISHSKSVDHDKRDSKECPNDMDDITPSEKNSEDGDSIGRRGSSFKKDAPTQPHASKRKVHKSSNKLPRDKGEHLCSSDSATLSEHSRNLTEEVSSSKGMKLASSKRSIPGNISLNSEDEEGASEKGKHYLSHESELSHKSKSQERKRPDGARRNKMKEKSDVPKACHPVPASNTTEKEGSPARPSQQHVHSAIGQTVRDHMFDNSLLMSSVDSWASAFPPSPVTAHRSLPIESSTKTPSPVSKPWSHGTPLQSTSLTEIIDMSDEEVNSGEEFEEDPLLRLLREQRAQYIRKLELIEQRLQVLGSDDLGS